MKFPRTIVALFVFIISFILFISGCGSDEDTVIGTSTKPTVNSTIPANGATQVSTGTVISATFSKDLDYTTVTPSSFSLNNGITGTLIYANKIVTFAPSNNLVSGTSYTATITTSIKDTAGNAMDQNYSWSFTTESQSAVTWLKTYGNGFEGVNSIIEVSDGFVAGGQVFTEDSTLIIKVDLQGNLLWRKTHPYGRGSSIIATPTGNFAMLANKSLLFFDNTGNFVDQKQYSLGGLNAVCNSSDNGFLIAGEASSTSDVVVIKTDASGNLIWSKTLGGSSSESSAAIVPTNNGGCVIAGDTESSGAGGADLYLIKLDALGNVIFEKTFGGVNDDYSNGLTNCTDGGYLICGYTRSFDGGNPNNKVSYVVKTDSDGVFSWQKTYGTNESKLSAVKNTFDNGYIFTGYGYFDNTSYDLILLKIDSEGTQLWQRTYEGGQSEMGYGIVSASDGGYAIAGRIGQVSAIFGNSLLIKTEVNGNW